jgi:phosphohistidine phosphatase
MKTLYLIRHAESDWKNEETDFDRSLTPKGIIDASVMQKRLDNLNFKPDIVICSPALRTKTTAQIITNNITTVFESSIYEAPINNLIRVINALPNMHKNVALIGHNPAISSLVNYLTGDFMNNMKPCTIVKVDLEIDNWDEITQGSGTEVFCIYPESEN